MGQILGFRPLGKFCSRDARCREPCLEERLPTTQLPADPRLGHGQRAAQGGVKAMQTDWRYNGRPDR
jgi:hypothetical protein